MSARAEAIASIESYPDYLTTPHHIRPSFHTRVGKPPQQVGGPVGGGVGGGASEEEGVETGEAGSEAGGEAPANEFGYPVPGVQSPSTVSVMAQDYFVSANTWSNILDHGVFDFVVVGSGCTALAFISQMLDLKPKARILCLERGDFWLPSHFQNLPLPFKMVLGGPSETFPWTLSRKTFDDPELMYCHGSCPFFGGRSTFWSAWSPQPTLSLMRDFPDSMVKTATPPKFWEDARALLNVVKATEIDNTIFAGLQKAVDKKLELSKLGPVPTADISEPAWLAVGRRSPTSALRFNKFSVPGPMLGLFEKQKALSKNNKGSPLELAINTVVSRMHADEEGIVRIVETNQGVLSWSNNHTKVILCAGAFPNATMLLNSFPNVPNVGKRITGHFLTHITARIPVEAFDGWHTTKTLQIAAHYVAGLDKDTKRQYHIQITAIHSPHPKDDAVDAARECPDYAAAATFDQLDGSEEYVVFVCATLGEFAEDNPNSFLKLNRSPDPTSNVTLQYTLTGDDKKLWTTMDEATYQTIDVMAGSNFCQKIDYWDENKHGWYTEKPPVTTIRTPGIVHEASSSFVGTEAQGGSLDPQYRPHDIKNVYVTGAALFPTAGSWNPTLTMCGFAQDLATKLAKDLKDPKF